MLYRRTTPSPSVLGKKCAFKRGSSTRDTSQCSPGTARLLDHTSTWLALSRRATQSPRRARVLSTSAHTTLCSTVSCGLSSAASGPEEKA